MSAAPDNETKPCDFCGCSFSRYWFTGRRIGDKVWSKKKYCSRTCFHEANRKTDYWASRRP